MFKSMGEDVRIDDHVCIKSPELVTVGSVVSVDYGFYCTTQLELLDHVHIAAHCCVLGGKGGYFKMGNFTGLSAGSRVLCTADSYEGDSLVLPWFKPEHCKREYKPVVFGDFVMVGMNCVILPGVTIAQGTAVGAGSLVTRSTEPWSVYAGSPARKIRDRSQKLLDYAKELGYEYQGNVLRKVK